MNKKESLLRIDPKSVQMVIQIDASFTTAISSLTDIEEEIGCALDILRQSGEASIVKKEVYGRINVQQVKQKIQTKSKKR